MGATQDDFKHVGLSHLQAWDDKFKIHFLPRPRLRIRTAVPLPLHAVVLCCSAGWGRRERRPVRNLTLCCLHTWDFRLAGSGHVMCWPRRSKFLDFCTATKPGSRCWQQPRPSCASGSPVVFRNHLRLWPHLDLSTLNKSAFGTHRNQKQHVA